jgi:hypothetical protein
VFSEIDIFGFIRSKPGVSALLPERSLVQVLLFLSLSAGLLKQSDPNWVAYLFLTDNKPFEDRLQEIVGHFRDPRVRYFDVDKQHRPAVRLYILVYFGLVWRGCGCCVSADGLFATTVLQFTKIDGGYTATDYALKRLLQEQSCQWLSVTNGDNAYGSDVVRNVLRHIEFSAVNAADHRPAQMLLAPLDSRNFAALGEPQRICILYQNIVHAFSAL